MAGGFVGLSWLKVRWLMDVLQVIEDVVQLQQQLFVAVLEQVSFSEEDDHIINVLMIFFFLLYSFSIVTMNNIAIVTLPSFEAKPD